MFLDILYTALATIGIIILVQVLTFVGARILVPPEPRIIYREVPVMQPAPVQAPKVAFTEPSTQQQVVLPEYEPRQQASDSLRLDPQLPPGIQETRPPGT
jgi:hypothetical protein